MTFYNRSLTQYWLEEALTVSPDVVVVFPQTYTLLGAIFAVACNIYKSKNIISFHCLQEAYTSKTFRLKRYFVFLKQLGNC